MNRVADLIVVSGPPGAGKSTVAQSLVSSFEPSALIAGDVFFGFLDRGYIDPWTSAAHRQNELVMEAAAAATGRLVAGGYTVVYDGVVGPWFLDSFLAATGVDALNYVLLLPAQSVVLERVGSRSGHGFTDLDAARHMYEQFAAADVALRHVVSAHVPPADIAATVLERLHQGGLRATAS